MFSVFVVSLSVDVRRSSRHLQGLSHKAGLVLSFHALVHALAQTHMPHTVEVRTGAS